MTLRAVLLTALMAAGLMACGAPDGPSAGRGRVSSADSGGALGDLRTVAAERSLRRLYDGAPPVIPHVPFGAACIACHHEEGLAVPDVGFAPPSPHGPEAIAGAMQRCRQCHVFQNGAPPWSETTFVALRQDLRRGRRLHDGAPPVMPHRVFMRENCLACHSGPAAREEIRTTHPERPRCRQCHVEQTTTAVFSWAGS